VSEVANPNTILLTIAEAAAILNISRTKAYEMAKNQELPVVRIGRSIRVPRHALMHQINMQTTYRGRHCNVPETSYRGFSTNGGNHCNIAERSYRASSTRDGEGE